MIALLTLLHRPPACTVFVLRLHSCQEAASTARWSSHQWQSSQRWPRQAQATEDAAEHKGIHTTQPDTTPAAAATRRRTFRMTATCAQYSGGGSTCYGVLLRFTAVVSQRSSNRTVQYCHEQGACDTLLMRQRQHREVDLCSSQFKAPCVELAPRRNISVVGG